MANLQTPDGVLEHMKGATSETEWNKRCDEVKAANSGYPSFWFATMILSGEADKVLAKFGADTKLRVFSLA